MTSQILGLADKVNAAFSTLFLDAVLTRETPGTGPAYDPGPSTTTTYNCKALADDYSAFIRGQGLVNASDMKVMIIAKTLSVTPQPLDKIEITAQGFNGQIIAGGLTGTPPVSTDPATAIWEVRCQK